VSRALGNHAGRGLELPTVDGASVRAIGIGAAVVCLGGLVVVAPPVALAAAGGVVIAAVLSGIPRVPVAVIAVVGTLAVVGVVDLPRRFVVGPTTSYAWMTVAVAVLLVAMSTSRHVVSALRGTGLLFVPLYVFGGWAVLSMAWFGVSFAGLQNVLVYAAFAALIPVTAAAVFYRDLALPTARRAVTCTFLLASGLYAGSLAMGGLGGLGIVGPRSYALVGVVAVAWGAAHARFGDRRLGLLAAASWLLILLSLSRLAFAAALVILVVASLDLRSPGRFVRSAVVIGSVSAVAFYAITSFGPMAARFAEGDVQSVGGGLAINVEGRSSLWDLTWRSYRESPIVGKGVGSAEQVIGASLGEINHPHNDYLRILHDFGLIGLVLFAASVVGLLVHSGRSLRAVPGDRDEAPLHLAAILALLGLLVGMSTDNAIVYLFMAAPVAVIVGLSIGARMLRIAATDDRRPGPGLRT
jgi:O-antigen ligase